MPIAVTLKREFDLIATDADSNPCIFPRDPSNQIFVDAFAFKTKNIDDTQPTRYLAFPFVVKIGSSLVGIFSDNDAHAVDSSGQWMIRSDDDGQTWQKVKFFDSAAPAVFDTSLLQTLLSPGQSVVLKIWTVKNNAGVLTVTSQSTASLGGDVYSLWSKAVPAPGGNLWRTGYTTVAGDTQTALFQSADGGVTWTGVSVIFSGAAKRFTEADVINLNGTAWLSLAREDNTSATANSVYFSISSDDGVTWAAPVLLNSAKVNGRQPNLTKTTDGNIVFSSADRQPGSSSYSSSGVISPFLYDTSGITVYGKPLVSLTSNPLTTSGGPGTTTVNVFQDSHGYVTGDVVFIFGATGFDGIPAAELNKFHTITRFNNNIYQITTTTGATAGGVSGGGAAVRVYNITQWGWRTRVAGMFSTDGGQPYTNEISTPNYVNTVFYQRRSNAENPIIASATYYAPNL